MKQKTWHGILLDAEFVDKNYPEKLRCFAKRKSRTNPWTLFGIEVSTRNFKKLVKDIQQNLKSDKPYYAHFYNDENLVVIFKDKVIKVKTHSSSWKPIIEFGRTLNIPEIQLDFWPNRFQDEIHYFNPDDFIK